MNRDLRVKDFAGYRGAVGSRGLQGSVGRRGCRAGDLCSGGLGGLEEIGAESSREAR